MSPYQSFVQKWKDCQLCPLGGQRTKIVLARGSVPCDVLFVGEAPGDSENVIGKPFVGPAGRLLDEILMDALIGIQKSLKFGFTNLVACFPREAKAAKVNEPAHEEINACSDRLKEFVTLCKPRLIVTVGKLATKHLALTSFAVKSGPTSSIFRRLQDRPQWAIDLKYADIDHPAYIIRANIAQQGLLKQRAVVNLAMALEEL